MEMSPLVEMEWGVCVHPEQTSSQSGSHMWSVGVFIGMAALTLERVGIARFHYLQLENERSVMKVHNLHHITAQRHIQLSIIHPSIM